MLERVTSHIDSDCLLHLARAHLELEYDEVGIRIVANCLKTPKSKHQVSKLHHYLKSKACYP